MGVYIKGMEMPEYGFAEIRIYPDGSITEMLEGYEMPVGKAVPVPPHGDLIDKKAVSENLVKVLNEKTPPFTYPDWNDAIVAMLTAPVIIPAEEEGEGGE